MPILGIIASSFRSAAGPEGAYDSLATVTLSASTASVTFAGIPAGYKHLQLRILARGNFAYGNLLDGTMFFNGDTTIANYYDHYLKGNGTAASASAANAPYMSNIFAGANQTASVFGVAVIDILDYANTNKYKTMRYLGGTDVNGSGQLNLGSILWKNTAAISSLYFAVDGSMIANSQLALYGIK
jgi:hypothetical protein